MKAVTCLAGELTVEDVAEPIPGPGQVLLEVLRCGICGSDLHARHHCDHWGGVMQRSGYPRFMRADQPVVFGHEFCGQVLEYGPDCKRKLPIDTTVCALPILRNGPMIDVIGLSLAAPGAYAERVVVQEAGMMPVPSGLSADLAALTEPMAVAWHAVNRGEIKRRSVCLVVGCGPVGLAVISILKARGVEHVVAADFSPGRRALARRMGADVVVDPHAESPYLELRRPEFTEGVDGLMELVLGTRERLGQLPIPWWHSWNLLEKLGGKPQAPVIFECVGVPGVLQSVIEGAPVFSRIVVVGVCTTQDNLEPSLAINKEIELRFVAGYSPLEFRQALMAQAEGRLDGSPLLTGRVGLDGVAQAFEALGDPERHAKILIDPQCLGVQL